MDLDLHAGTATNSPWRPRDSWIFCCSDNLGLADPEDTVLSRAIQFLEFKKHATNIY